MSIGEESVEVCSAPPYVSAEFWTKVQFIISGDEEELLAIPPPVSAEF